MVRGFLLLLAVAPLLAPLPQDDDAIVRSWIQAVRTHEPGVVDAPLLQVADAPPTHFRAVGRRLRTRLTRDFVEAEVRNDIVRRGVVLHTDLALLLPEQAAVFRREGGPFDFDVDARPPFVRRGPEQVFLSTDGEYQGASLDTAHWWMARQLIRLIRPRPWTDDFARSWYRAVAARFQASRALGSNSYHLSDGLSLFPLDPYLLLYAGAMHEANASPHVQNMMQSRFARQLQLPSAEDEWRKAEPLLRNAVKEKGPPEASVRLGRVFAWLGRHADAAAALREVAPRLAEPRLQYLCALFLGSEEAALGRRDAARELFERAATLFPLAQSPLIALADLAWSAGRRGAALEALERLQRLPRDPLEREDPWRGYHGGDEAEAERQLAAVRALVAGKGRP